MKLVCIVIRKVILKLSALKHDDDKMIKIANKFSASMAQVIVAMNNLSMEGIIETLSKMNLKG